MKFWFFQVITDIFPYYNETSFEKKFKLLINN